MSEHREVEKKVDESWKEQIEKERRQAEPAAPSRPAQRPAAPPKGATAGAPPPTGGVRPREEGRGQADARAAEPEEAHEEPAGEDPDSIIFEQFIQSLAIQASMFLGASPDPRTGLVSEDLGQAKYMIDIIGMIANKTRGNLTPREQQLMAMLLQDLRMAYVHRAQAAAQMPGPPGMGGMPGQQPR